MTMAPQTTALATTHAALDAKAQTLLEYDTGQHDACEIDADQIDAAHFEAIARDLADDCNEAKSLAVTFHEIHRIDESAQGEKELITSTLKYFSLHLAVQDDAGDLQFNLDGLTVVASLVYEDGQPVEELSATHEPALLAAAGESPPKSIIEGGVAVLRLRITVLSSLCNKRSFCVRIAAPERPELEVMTAPVKTITKLRRAPREALDRTKSPPVSPLVERHKSPKQQTVLPLAGLSGSGCGAKRGFDVLDNIDCSAHAMSKCAAWSTEDCLDQCGQSLDELWDQVASNGARLLELQAQQRRLFKELRELKATDLPESPFAEA